MDRGAWWAAVHGVTKSQTRLSNLHFHVILVLWKKKFTFIGHLQYAGSERPSRPRFTLHSGPGRLRV